MLQRLRQVMPCLLILPALMTVSAMGFQGEIGAQATPGGDASPQVSSGKAVDCGELAGLVQQERSTLSREIGQIKREIAAMRDDLSKPGLKEIFAGIGYIFGLTGIALYFHCRRNKTQVVRGDASTRS